MDTADTKLSIGDAGSLLMGAGLVKLDDLTTGFLLIGAGIILKVGVAILKKKGLDVSSGTGTKPPLG